MKTIAVIGGGAAGFFAAIHCAETAPQHRVIILEKSSHLLAKVRISGGGRCNVTHACFDARELSKRYPRGGRALIGPFTRFQPRDTVAWFEHCGVMLKTEPDGRVFPITDSSETIAQCLEQAALAAGVQVRTKCGVERIATCARGFDLALGNGESLACDALLIASGGCRTSSAGELIAALGHKIEPPVPSLFTFHIESEWLRELPGISVDPVEAGIPGTKLRERGPLLVTHTGVSGPAILRLSAWGARELHECGYEFPLRIAWLPDVTEQQLLTEFQQRRTAMPTRQLVNAPVAKLPVRLWEKLIAASGIASDARWNTLTRDGAHALARMLCRTEFAVRGKSLNKEEFVTCGGVSLREVDFKTMQSRIQPRLYFAGEVLDIDGITGGFNFQSAWTTGWIAGQHIAQTL